MSRQYGAETYRNSDPVPFGKDGDDERLDFIDDTYGRPMADVVAELFTIENPASVRFVDSVRASIDRERTP